MQQKTPALFCRNFNYATKNIRRDTLLISDMSMNIYSVASLWTNLMLVVVLFHFCCKRVNCFLKFFFSLWKIL
jgi:hypothetical protein